MDSIRPNASLPVSLQGALLPLFESLSRLHCDQFTGILYFTTHEKRAGQFVLNQGEVIGVIYACKKGMQALALLESATGILNFRLAQKSVSTGQAQALPAMDELFSQFNQLERRSEGDGAEVGEVRAGIQPRRDLTTISQEPLSKQQLEDLYAIAAEYLGPLAKPVVDRSIAQAQETTELIHLLVQKVRDSEDQERLSAELRRILA